jgi:hypothetical protein
VEEPGGCLQPSIIGMLPKTRPCLQLCASGSFENPVHQRPIIVVRDVEYSEMAVSRLLLKLAHVG